MTLTPRSANHLLAGLSPEDFELLRPHLRPAELVFGEVLAETGAPLGQAYFPLGGVISLVVALATGETVESAMVGRDSVFGASIAFDGKIARSHAIVQNAGLTCTVDGVHLQQAAERSASLRSTLIRHEQVILLQSQQSVACNAYHTVEARLSRWLLRMRDLSGDDTLPLTQEFLAQMIGVRRNSVSRVANMLQVAGIIRYRRGRIEIVDGAALTKSSCECYETVKAHYANLIETN